MPVLSFNPTTELLSNLSCVYGRVKSFSDYLNVCIVFLDGDSFKINQW